ncbi:golgi apparatus protein 1 [Marchantia polymorpha subsp. ruderalis]|uniref:Golgi apparatus protein 1 n=1 Tax=Marchantia polymorpha TaxID=3197 RepID=A0A2R6W7Q9_MARPO|nr:hypothetical protein MARPO_0133s0036 [Marchantia polymorpha]|eukprot:PTQ29891.1 hypothetical protein MARPO_0133s0036 [Marchantia polymorpha]
MALRSKIWTPSAMNLAVVFILVAVLGCHLSLVNSLNEDDSRNSGTDSSPNKSVETAPQENIQETFDLDPKGNCSDEIKNFCTPKTGSYLECITQELQSEQAGNMAPNGKEISDPCKIEVRFMKIASYKDLTLDKKIEAACQKDIEDTCSNYFLGPGGVLACLREHKDTLSQACQNEVFVAEKDAANDYQMDPLLSEKCGADAQAYCSDVSPEGGRVQACLRARASKVTYACRAELFRQEQENAGDLRLNVQLYKACEDDKKKFCADVRPGNARIKDCLENFRMDPGFSKTCKVEFDKMLARRAEDFRLDPVLRDSCRKDISAVCGSELEDLLEVPREEPRVIHCLQDFQEELTDPQCKKEVHRALVRAAEDYRFDAFFAKSCEDSKQKYCKDADNSRVLQCLQGARDMIDTTCRSAVFELESRLSGDIDYKVAMKASCGMEIGKFCKGLRHDQGAIIDCLQQKVDDPDMGEDCKKEVVLDEIESAKDYRLNYRIYNDCLEDVRTLCPISTVCGTSEPCGGIVMKCLQTNMEKIKSEACKKDIFSFTLKEAKNPELNIPLQTACHEDLKKYCPKVRTKDHSQSLRCLRSHRNQLKSECKDEELRFSMMEASDIRLTPSLMNACGAELGEFCKAVSPTNGDAFKCLQMHLEKVEMGTPCKIEVDLQEARQASDYRLDVRVRTECQKDVETLCGDVDKSEEGHATVLKCFVAQYKNLTGGCQTEVAYAVRMALWQYQFGSNLTLPCDSVVKSSCDTKEAKAIENVVIGTYGQCLTLSQNFKGMNPECKALVRVATKEGFYVGDNPEADLAAEIAKLKELRGSSSDLGQSGMGFFWTTTVVAFVALLGVALFRRYSGPPRAYTLVVKGGDV